jgi:peptidoglycan/LPS O-acetylase OafA/YrhL
MKDSKQVVYFKNIDILRFVAVFLVLFAHAYEGWCGWFGKPGFMTVEGNHTDFTNFGSYLNTAFTNGGIGVDIFFLISGFLITYLLLSEKENTGKISIAKFYFRRVLRIWPAYFLLIALTPLCVHLANGKTPDYLPNVLFYNNFHAISIKIWQYPYAHLWSICVEEHFYLFWPFVVAFIARKNLKTAFLLLIAMSFLFRTYLFVVHSDYWQIYLNTLSRIDVLVIGGLYALYYKEYGFQAKLSKSTRLILYGLFIVVYVIDPVYTYDSFFDIVIKKYFYVSILGLGMIHFIFNEDRIFNLPFQKSLNYLGKISYGIYLFSNVLIPIVVIRFMYQWGSTNMYLYFFLNIFLSILISAIVYELLEKQVLKWKKKFEVVHSKRN